MSGMEEGAMEEEIGVLCSRKIFWYSRKRIVADREGTHNEFEDIDVVLQIEGISQRERKEDEKDRKLSPVEGYPLHLSSHTQARICVEHMTSCASPRSEVRSENLSLVVSEASKYSSKGSQISGSSMTTQI
jgi:hypothetical protein